MGVLLLSLLLAAGVDEEAGAAGVRGGLSLSSGVLGGDVVAGVDVGFGVETAPFSLHLRAPVFVRLMDGAPVVDGAVPSFCRALRCEEILAGERLDPTAVARLLDELRILRVGAPFHLRAGRLTTTLGAGAALDRFTTAASWDRRTSGLVASLRLPTHAVAVDVVVGDVTAPGELTAARMQAQPFDDDGLAGRLRVGLESAIDAFAPVDVVDRHGLPSAGARTRTLSATTAEVSARVLDDVLALVPRVEMALMTGLSRDGVQASAIPGLGGAVGVDVGVDVDVVDVRGRAMLSYGGAGYRRGVFSTLHLVERRRALVGSAVAGGGVLYVPAPGGVGVDLRLEASIWDVVAPLMRLHTEEALGGNALEAGFVVDIDPIRVSVTALRRGFVDAGGVISADLAAVPLVGALEASVRFWGPLSLGMRWLRLPRFPGDGSLRVDDDVLVTLSANALVPFP